MSTFIKNAICCSVCPSFRASLG